MWNISFNGMVCTKKSKLEEELKEIPLEEEIEKLK